MHFARFARALGRSLSLGITLSSCALRTADVRNKYSSEFACPTSQVRIQQLNDDQYRADGCDRTAYYECSGGSCTAVDWTGAEDEGREPTAARSEAGSAAPSGGGAQTLRSNAASSTKGKKASVVTVDVQLPNRALLKLVTAPAQYGQRVQLRLARIESEGNMASCQIDLMVNGQRLQMPKARFVQQRGLSTLVAEVPRDIVAEMGVAEQLALRVCDERWSLSPEQIGQVRQFVMRYEEELAWLREPGRGGSGLFAPAGGWPAWKPAGNAAPPFTGGTQLDGQAMFKLLSPSVFQIETLSAGGSFGGSAVAVSATELVTNCHVLEGARKIILRQNKREWVARVARSHPKSDRCMLTVADATFTPARGVRAYADLQIGEPLFTLGAPRGLELTLANGILSGLREEDGRKYVQTTAPISPGSSGGGLFDARGNLVGVTTMVLADKARLNQGLNFAIPADSFWQP